MAAAAPPSAALRAFFLVRMTAQSESDAEKLFQQNKIDEGLALLDKAQQEAEKELPVVKKARAVENQQTELVYQELRLPPRPRRRGP